MATEFKFPDVGEGLTEGKLVAWKVKVGDTVAVDQTLAEVETDKAVVQIPSPVAGTVTALHNNEGDTLTVGDVILTFDGESGQAPAPQQSQQPEQKVEETKPAQESTKEFEPVREVAPQHEKSQVPKVPEEHEVKELPTFEKPSGETPSQPHPHDGILAMPAVRKMARDHNIDLTKIQPTGKQGQITMDDLHHAADSLGQQMASEFIPPKAEDIPVPKPVNPIPKKEEKEEVKETVTTEFAVHDTTNMGNLLNTSFATPKVRRYARHLGVDIHKVTGSGKHGMIMMEDIDKVVGVIPAKDAPEVQEEKKLSPQDIKSAPDLPMKDEDEIVAMSQIRKIIANRMRESLDNVAQVTHVEEVDMTNLFNLREKEKPSFEQMGVKLTYLPFMIKAVIGALQKYPYFNATIKGETIVLRKKYHIGIAVDTPHGLMVPVIKDANKKSILKMSKEIKELADLARDRKISPNDVTGSTFTISSVGNLGGVTFTPIINYPEVAILGVAKIREEPRIINNQIYARKVMNLCLTFDHRVVDGADAARFTSLVKSYLEDPQKLFMETI